MHSTPPPDEYEEFPESISFAEFNFERYYTLEDTVLRPQLEKEGYYSILFMPGEFDDFGPLSRICSCIDKDGVLHKFVYG